MKEHSLQADRAQAGRAQADRAALDRWENDGGRTVPLPTSPRPELLPSGKALERSSADGGGSSRSPS